MTDSERNVLIDLMQENLQDLRKKCGYSQEALAELIGTSRYIISNLENYNREMAWDECQALIHVFLKHNEISEEIQMFKSYEDELENNCILNQSNVVNDKEGVLVILNSVPIFIPQNKCILDSEIDLKTLLDTTKQLIIVEKGANGLKVIGSIKYISEDEYVFPLNKDKENISDLNTQNGIIIVVDNYRIFIPETACKKLDLSYLHKAYTKFDIMETGDAYSGSKIVGSIKYETQDEYTAKTIDDNVYEESEYDDFGENNTYIEYNDKKICIKLNEDYPKWIQISAEHLSKKYQSIKDMISEDKMQEIVDNVFTEGFTKEVYIRNLTFEKNGYDINTIAIRPQIVEGDYLYSLLGSGQSLLFVGNVRGKKFVLDRIYDTVDSERLDFEVSCTIIPYKSEEEIYDNFLYDVLENVESLAKHTSEKLTEWKEYLQWRKELTRKQIYGCKYYKVTYDKETENVIFWLACINEEYFNAFKKYLRREIQVFNNDYSENEWIFDLARNDKNKRFDKSRELGKYVGIIEEYYLNALADLNDAANDLESPNDNNNYYELNDINIDDLYYNAEKDKEDELYDFETEKELMLKEKNNAPEKELKKHFSNPYVVKVAFELDIDEFEYDAQSDLPEKEIEEIIKSNILRRYYPSGFLALSAVGEFVLIDRFEKAIERLEKNESISPNLVMWLFNVKRARLPKEEDINYLLDSIDDWLDENIKNNENQKIAVAKMLAAPDLCLIQGPPGTGKTTVIAEAIYQFAKRGNRILLASQSNDAVDNALERLAESTNIRAIRLGHGGYRRKAKDDDTTIKFEEASVLKYYYSSISTQISKSWLDKWADLEKLQNEYKKDKRDAKNFLNDVDDLNSQVAELEKSIVNVNQEYTLKKQEYEKINETNKIINHEKRQLNIFIDQVDSKKYENIYFTEQQCDIIYDKIIPLVSKYRTQMIYLLPESISTDVEKNLCIALILNNFESLKRILEKIRAVDKHGASTDVRIYDLEKKKEEKQAEMIAAIMANSDVSMLRSEYNVIDAELQKLKNASACIDLSSNEKKLLSSDTIEEFAKSIFEPTENILSNMVFEFETAIKDIINLLANYSDMRTMIDTTQIKEEMISLDARVEKTRQDIADKNRELTIMNNTLHRLSQKYNVDSLNSAIIIDAITEKENENDEVIKKETKIREQWENTLTSFKSKLDDEHAYEYDKEYYQDVYVKACNVVGISCTDNMKYLADKGYDEFDVVIIDEVSKATPPELLIPLMKAQKAILVGDHRQLPPMFNEHMGAYKELINSDIIDEELADIFTMENFKRFEKMVTSALFKEYFEDADNSIKHSLLTQYRMHSDISDVINRFYEGNLKNGLSRQEENIKKSHNLTIKDVDGGLFIVPEKHAYWIDSSTLRNGKPIYETFLPGSTSATNINEKYIIIELLKKIAIEYKNQGYNSKNKKTVGVISFYQRQVNEIRRAFKNEKTKFDFSSISVDINTVDRFQGKEKNIIITSLVRNNADARASQHVVAFERINVAFSRAQELLVIVGAKHMYENIPIKLPNMSSKGEKTVPAYKNIMEELYRCACFKYGEKIVTPEVEKRILDEYERVRKEK